MRHFVGCLLGCSGVLYAHTPTNHNQQDTTRRGGTQVEVVYSSIRWTPALYRAVKAKAQQDGISVNELVRRLMAEALKVELDDRKESQR